MDKFTEPIKNIRKTLLWVSIGLFGLSALIGIWMILFSANTVGGQVISTTAILGLLTLLSANNLARIEDHNGAIKVMSIISLCANLVWSLIWIALVWGIFEKMSCTLTTHYGSTYYSCSRDYYDFLGGLWRIVAFSGTLSFLCTTISNLLRGEHRTTPITVTRYLAIGTDILLCGFFLLEIIANFKIRIDEAGAKILAVLFVIFVASSIICLILTAMQRRKAKKQYTQSKQSLDEQALREQIEAEVRAKIASEQQASEDDKKH